MAEAINQADSAQAPGSAAPSRVRQGALTGYHWLLAAFLLMGVVQIFLAGLGVFSLNGRQLGAPGETAFDPHRSLGYTMAGVALLILVLALVARPGARAIILSAVMFLLASFMQSLLAGLGDNAAVFGGLHAVDGLLILSIAGFLFASSRQRRT